MLGEREPNLYSLARTSRRLATIALPLLYEQLSDSKDIERMFLSDTARERTSPPHMAFVRYLHLSLGASCHYEDATLLLGRLHQWLAERLDVAHLYLDLNGASADSSALLVNLANTPGLRNLRSLRIFIDRANHQKHTLFRDCAHFRFLTGLYMEVPEGIDSFGRAEQPLAHLKQLEASFVANLDDISACMAIASPPKLEILYLETTDLGIQPDLSVAIVFGDQTWECLENLRIDTEQRLERDIFVTERNQLPALRALQLTLWRDDFLIKQMSYLPPGLKSFSIEPRGMGQLADCLVLIGNDKWLSGGVQQIKLTLINSCFYNTADQTYTKADLTDAAHQAGVAAEMRGVVLEPKDIVSEVASLSYWRRCR